MIHIDKTHFKPVIYETSLSYLSAERSEINDRVTRLALDEKYKDQFVDGQKLYQQFALGKKDVVRTVNEHNSPLHQLIAKPDPSDLTGNLEVQAELMSQQESAAAKIVATQLGFVYQALAQKDLSAAVLGIQRQREMLCSPPIVKSFAGQIIPIFEENISDLPNFKQSLDMIEFWDSETRVPELVHYAYLQKGMSLSLNSHDQTHNSPSQLVEQIVTSSIRGGENVSFIGESELRQHLFITLGKLQPEVDSSTPDELLGGKLLQSIIDTPEIFDHLHPRVQLELKTILSGFLLDSKIDESTLHVLPSPEIEMIPPMIQQLSIEPVAVTKPPISVEELTIQAFNEILPTIKIGQTKSIFNRFFKKNYIHISERDRIDDLRRTLEQTPEYQSREPSAVALVRAYNKIKKHIDNFNGLSE